MNKEYITTILCFLGLHKLGKKENGSKFINDSYWAFGWVGRWVRTCEWCDTEIYHIPFLKSERKRLIQEMADKKDK